MDEGHILPSPLGCTCHALDFFFVFWFLLPNVVLLLFLSTMVYYGGKKCEVVKIGSIYGIGKGISLRFRDNWIIVK